MNNYVISLTTSTKRRHHIVEQFDAQNIKFKFFDAIEPHKNSKISTDLVVNISDCDLTPGEVACLLSHVSLWKMMVDQQFNYMAIFEDDILLGESAELLLNSTQWIPQHADLIKLEKFAAAAKMKLSTEKVSHHRKLRQLTGKHLGAAGYILTLNAARKLLDYVQQQKKLIAVDHILFEVFIENKQLNILQLLPGICIQSDQFYPTEQAILSDLEFERRQRFDLFFAQQKNTKRSLKDKLNRELMRLINQIGLLLGKITFK